MASLWHLLRDCEASTELDQAHPGSGKGQGDNQREAEHPNTAAEHSEILWSLEHRSLTLFFITTKEPKLFSPVLLRIKDISGIFRLVFF